MEKLRFYPPYLGKKTRFPETQKKSGVYLIAENGKIVYIGSSGVNLYKTMYRHFQTWNHKFQEVVTYKDRRKKYTVRIVKCTAAQAERLEKQLILKHVPRDNSIKYDSYKPDKRDKKILEEYAGLKVSTEPLPF